MITNWGCVMTQPEDETEDFGPSYWARVDMWRRPVSYWQEPAPGSVIPWKNQATWTPDRAGT